MNISPLPIQKFFDNNGVPLVGGRLFTYAVGTSTKVATYKDQAGTLNANPVPLDYRGEANVWLDVTVVYKFVLAPPGIDDPPTNPIWTVDNISAAITYVTLTRQIIGQLLNPRTATEISSGITPTDYGYREGDVRRYGAVLNGVTNDTVAFQSAGLVSLDPYAPAGSTVITSSIPIRSNQEWSIDGLVINITGTSVEVFTATTVNDWAIRGLWEVVGDNTSTGSTSGSAAALRITDCMRFEVDTLIAKTIKGWGIRGSPGSSTSARGEKGDIAAFQAHGCYIGFEVEAGTGAEYINFTSPIITRCNTGCRVAAGNCNVTGGNIVDNTTGVDLVNGSNHGHGIFCGVQINHNTTQVKANTVTNGQTFTGCHFFQGIVHFDHSTGVLLRDGIVDVDAYRFEESDGCGFTNNTMTDGYANAISNDYNGTHSYTVWQGNRTLKGEPWRGGLGNIKGVRVTNALASNQVFSAANVNATSVIKLDDSANASANQATQTTTAYDAYSATTGIYTVVKGGDGKSRVNAQLVITNNAADAGKFQCFMSHSVLGDYYFDLVPLAPAAAATSWIASLNCELPVDITNTLTFKITGSGVANNVTVTNSGGTKAQVEGL